MFTGVYVRFALLYVSDCRSARAQSSDHVESAEKYLDMDDVADVVHVLRQSWNDRGDAGDFSQEHVRHGPGDDWTRSSSLLRRVSDLGSDRRTLRGSVGYEADYHCGSFYFECRHSVAGAFVFSDVVRAAEETVALFAVDRNHGARSFPRRRSHVFRYDTDGSEDGI